MTIANSTGPVGRSQLRSVARQTAVWMLTLSLACLALACSPYSERSVEASAEMDPSEMMETDPPGAGETPVDEASAGALAETYQADTARLAAVAEEMAGARDSRYLGRGVGGAIGFSVDSAPLPAPEPIRAIEAREDDVQDRPSPDKDISEPIIAGVRPPAPGPPTPPIVTPPPLPPPPPQLLPPTTVALNGRMAWHAPRVMVSDQPYFLSAAVGSVVAGEAKSLLDSRLAADIMETLSMSDPAEIAMADLKVYPLMKASLSGGDFTIEALSEDEQAVEPGETTRWLWSVRPRNSGKLPLMLTFSRQVEVNGSRIEQTVRTFPRVIDVRTPEAIFLTSEQASRAASPAVSAPAVATAAPRGAPLAGEVGLCRPPTPAMGGPGRLALVIANESYTGVGIPALTFARRDGEEMSQALAASGFSVTYCENLGAEGLSDALSAFRERLKQARAAGGEASAVFYYAGHGVATPSKGQTYLLPISLRQANVSLVESQGVSVDAVVGGLASAGAERLVFIFDACRDVLKMEGGGDRGFSAIAWRTTADDIIAYATRFGEKAKDNGIYARTLSKAIREAPDPDAVTILDLVQKQVSDATGKAQIPDFTDRMPDRFSLRPATR